jgi:hypothetical protein
MRSADEMARKLETGAAAGSFDSLKEQLRAVVERPSDQSKPVEDLHGSNDRLDEPLRTTLKGFQRPGPQQTPVEEDGPVDLDDLRPGITSYPDHEASEREAIYDRPVTIESEMKRRSSRGFARYLVAILIGVAATLAWQSYGEATKQIIATRAPELGWSPETKQIIANWVEQLGWTKPPVVESKAAPVAQTAPATPSIDPQKVEQMARDLATLRQTVEQLAAGLDQVTREIGKLEAADAEILAKITPAPPPPQPPPAARKPTPRAPPSSPAPATPPMSLAPIPPPDQ